MRIVAISDAYRIVYTQKLVHMWPISRLISNKGQYMRYPLVFYVAVERSLAACLLVRDTGLALCRVFPPCGYHFPSENSIITTWTASVPVKDMCHMCCMPFGGVFVSGGECIGDMYVRVWCVELMWLSWKLPVADERCRIFVWIVLVS